MLICAGLLKLLTLNVVKMLITIGYKLELSLKDGCIFVEVKKP